MDSLLQGSVMTKPKGRPKTSDRNDVTVKMDRQVIDMARMVALHRKTTLAELLSDITRGPIEKMHAAMIRELGSK